MNRQTSVEGVYKRQKRWGLRLSAVLFYTAVMTLTAPLASVKSPPLRPILAQADEGELKSFARQVASKDYGWGNAQFRCLNALWAKESAWDSTADNPHSTAFGIAQMLGETSTNPFVQISNGLRYIEHRYTTPCNAWDYWQKNKWY